MLGMIAGKSPTETATVAAALLELLNVLASPEQYTEMLAALQEAADNASGVVEASIKEQAEAVKAKAEATEAAVVAAALQTEAATAHAAVEAEAKATRKQIEADYKKLRDAQNKLAMSEAEHERAKEALDGHEVEVLARETAVAKAEADAKALYNEAVTIKAAAEAKAAKLKAIVG